MTDISFETMGSGYHFKTGPAAIYYNPQLAGSGEYEVTATFSQAKSMGHEAYGIFIGGQNLQDSTQKYLYFVIKPCRSSGTCDPSTGGSPLGEALISYRSSNARPAAILPEGHQDAVNIEDPKTGAATNKLTIRVSKDSVSFLANDKVVKTLAKTALNGAPTEGLTGIRINHNLDLHVAEFKVTKK